MDFSAEVIPLGETKEEKKQRKKFIKDFFRHWATVNQRIMVFCEPAACPAGTTFY